METILNLNIERSCRMCLTQSEQLLSLYEKPMIGDCNKNLSEFMSVCLNYQNKMEQRDMLPNKICKKCRQTLIDFYVLKQKFIQTEKILKEFLLIRINENKDNYIYDKNIKHVKEENTLEGIFLSNDNLNLTSTDNLKEEEEEVQNLEENLCEDICLLDDFEIRKWDDNVDMLEHELEYFCIFCEQVYIGANYNEHCKRIHFMCAKCDSVFECTEHLKEHMVNIHSNAHAKQTFERSVKCNKNNLYCEFCNKRLGNREQFHKHMKLHKSLNLIMDYFESYMCDECQVMFLQESDFRKHIHDHEATGNKILEDNGYTDYQFLEDAKLPMRLVTCGVCGAKYESNADLKYHIILHSKSFSCPFEACGCEYDTFSRLSLHITKKHIYGMNNFCTHCKHRFSTYDELQAHIRNECNAKKFECNHCAKRFFSNKALQLHIKKIDGKRFTCQFCEKSFAQQGELTIHNRTHTGERPFKCTICSKTYKTASMRTAHMDTHIDGKTFTCNVCGTRLQTRTSYRNHMKRHTEEKKFTCDICTKKFFTKYNLKLHFLKVHKKNSFTEGN